MRALVTTVVGLALGMGLLAPPGGSPAARAAGVPPLASTDGWVRPVPGPVVRPFVAPQQPFGPGHRGVDLACVVGDAVHAAGPGIVAFAGAVAGEAWVTVVHTGGLRTSYGVLAGIRVDVGDPVVAGTVLGTIAGPAHPGGAVALHWSARRGATYLDPLDLLAGGRPSLVGPGEWRVGDLPEVPSYGRWDGRHHWGLVPSSPRADGPGWVLPPNANRVVGIAGLGTRTGEPPFDLSHLGYGDEDVDQFSYAPDGGAYGPEDTWRGVDAAARRLEADLRAAWAEHPGRAVDLVGHSMGGVVALHYLLHHHDPTDPGLPPIGHVVTVAAPVGGADLASALVDAGADPVGRRVLRTLGRLVADLDPTAPAVRDLAVGSDLLRALSASWDAAVNAPHASPLATGTRLLTLGGQADVIVPEHRSDLAGAPHALLPGTHDGVVRTEAVRIAVRDFLAGRPVPGEAGGVAHWLSYPLGWFERLAVDAVLPG